MKANLGNRNFRRIGYLLVISVIALSMSVTPGASASGYERKSDSTYYEVYFETPTYMPISSGTGGVEETPVKFYVKMNEVHSGFLGLQYRGPDWYKLTVYIDADAFWSGTAKECFGMKRWYPASTTEYGHSVSYDISASVGGDKASGSFGVSIQGTGTLDWDTYSPGSYYSDVDNTYRSTKYWNSRFWAPLGWFKDDFSNGIFIWDYPTRYSEGSFEIGTARDQFSYLMGRSDKDVLIWVHVDMHWMSNGAWSPYDLSCDIILGNHSPTTDVLLQWAEGSSSSSYS
ncbi:MAG: hypothetical protein ACTSP4_03290 [Candidatus Hodarchaeales archaeon]